MTAKGIAFLVAIAAVWPPLIIAGARRLLRKPKDEGEGRKLLFAKVQVLLWIFIAAFVMPEKIELPGQPYWLSACYFLFICAPIYIWGSIWVARVVEYAGGL